MTDNTNEPKEFIDHYSSEEINQAKAEIARMTPEEYLGMRDYIEAIEEQINFPEARAIVFTELASPHTGASFHLTIRGDDPITTIDRMAKALKYARGRYGLYPVQKYPKVKQAVQEQSESVTGQAEYQPAEGTAPVSSHEQNVFRPPKVLPSLPSTQAQQLQPSQPRSPQLVQPRPEQSYEGSDGETHGTNILNKIVVMENTVQFYVGKFKYPFKDSRGPEVVASLFDEELGWTPDHFAVDAAIYTPREWGGTLYVDWEKPGKYYNVVRVHR